MAHFVGRIDVLSRLVAALDAVGGLSDGGLPRFGAVLVGGTSGIGKTALLRRFAGLVAARQVRMVWGACWDADQAPAYWPWIQVFRALDGIARSPAEPGGMTGPPGTAVPPAELLAVASRQSMAGDADVGARMRLLDAAGRYLAETALDQRLVVVLDDLQWADPSTLELLRFVAGEALPAPVLIVGAYRNDELSPQLSAILRELPPAVERIELTGLDPGEVTELVEQIAGRTAARTWGDIVHERTNGHPFFTRELAHLIASGGTVAGIPAAVREVIARRTSRLSPPCARLVEAAVVAGLSLMPDVLTEVTGMNAAEVAQRLEEAAAAGVVTTADTPQDSSRDSTTSSVGRIAHDLFREVIYTSLTAQQRLDLHHRVAVALERRRERGRTVFAAELARHYAAAVPLAPVEPVVSWAYAAAEEDRGRYAFAEAAGHLSRARDAVEAVGIPSADLVGLLTAEADARMRAGETRHAQRLLAQAWDQAVEPASLAAVALGMERLGTRFAMPRTELVTVLERARDAVQHDPDVALRARITAALARQLQHSVPRDRPRAGPLAATAVDLARTLEDPATLADCLLAQHDVSWTPGNAARRVTIATEIAELARGAGDAERHAQALLLTASALLEAGSPAFRAELAQFRQVTAELRQPRHDYLLRTREAAIALLEGDLANGEQLIEQASELGTRIGEADTGNVRMSQMLELVRAGGDAQRLRQTAHAAIRWWVGVPVHAHAVAAGFYARAGDLDEARRELDTVAALGGWQEDRSYLWSIYVGELVVAAVAVGDRVLCDQLLAELLPIADACAVNGALVSFMGAHAHHVGLLCAALGRTGQDRDWLRRALDTHRRLGARTWTAQTEAELAKLGHAPDHPAASRPVPRQVVLRRVGELWEAGFGDQTAYLRDSKGLHDLSALLARPGTGIPTIELAGAAGVDATTAQPALDRTALVAYRRRLAELDDELDDAARAHDNGRAEAVRTEKEQLAAELRRATRPGGAVHDLSRATAERARKAVTGRIRDAIEHIRIALPELGRHLDRTIRTGTVCSYHPEEAPSHPGP